MPGDRRRKEGLNMLWVILIVLIVLGLAGLMYVRRGRAT
jgi:Tfp pilus assembly protein PilX